MLLIYSAFNFDMMDVRDQIGFFVLLGLIIFMVLLIRKFVQAKRAQLKRELEREIHSHHQDDIYNISSRVQSQGDQWPTHDAHLSLDHISIMNQMKPMYDDEPPSYDEVMKTQEQLTGEGSVPTELVIEAPKSTTTATRQQ